MMRLTGGGGRWLVAAGAAAVLVAGTAWPAAATEDGQEVRLSPYRVRPGQSVKIAALECGGPVSARSAAFRDEVELDGGPGLQNDGGFERDGPYGPESGDGPDGPEGPGGGPGDGFGDAPRVAIGWARVDDDAPRGVYSVDVDCQGDGDTIYGELFVVGGSGPNTGGGGLARAPGTAHGTTAAEEGTASSAPAWRAWGIGAAGLAGAGGLLLVRRRRAAGRV
ncbi:hypothetical protein [Streptosporangium sp. NPDC087985]|uniref:hypothetical protein n=1 Tax=Streptosporangium sp. NPDC087985 TaxID=3366196 RepID=UPI00380DA17C